MNKKVKILLVAMVACFGLKANVSAEEYSENFQKLTTDGVIQVNAIENPMIIENQGWGIQSTDIQLQMILDAINLGDSYYWSWTCSSTTECEISIVESKEVDGSYMAEPIETHTVKIMYLAEKNEEIASKVKTVIDQTKGFSFEGETVNENYVLDDLNLVNYYLAKTRGKIGFVTKAMNFVTDIKELIQNQPITIDLVRGFGTSGEGEDIEYIVISGSDAGTAIVSYDGVAYGYIDFMGTNIHNIIYIPEDTEDTKEAYIEAIQKRLNNNSIEVTCAGVLPEESETIYVGVDGIDLTKTDGNYYKLKIADTIYPFVVMKKAELNTPKYQQVEGTSGIQISTTDLSVPTDTIITVEEVKENTEEYNRIVEVLNVSNFKAFDISLYSETLGTNIRQLENGVFQVTIPLGQEYVGKSMVAYYIHDDNTIEEHDIVMDEEGNAIFETNHFSTYIITEKLPSVAEQNPNTYDGIINYVLMGVLALIILSGAVASLNNKTVK